MLIDQYYCETGGKISFTRQQGSDFAKRVADDFNPLHDVDAKRFCIPGDLLFSLVLSRYGVSETMEFVFAGMVSDTVSLELPAPSGELVLSDAEGRQYLRVARSGQVSAEPELVRNLTKNYVAFSGLTFPHILEPLMAQHNVMINPARPMVMYQSMSIELDSLAICEPELRGSSNELTVDGRRGEVRLAFDLVEAGAIVGRGCKRMLLSGLREYDADAMAETVRNFNAKKSSFV